MTRFWREGFFRRSRYGVWHWVEGHWVDRYDWSRYSNSYSSAELFRSRLTEARVGKSATARYVIPNADCPGCGDPVFYFRNKAGKEMHLDEVSPPWPEHRCKGADKQRTSSGTGLYTAAWPQLRSEDDVAEIEKLLELTSSDLGADFKYRFGHLPWANAIVLLKLAVEEGAILVLEGYNPTRFRQAFVVKKCPISLRKGTLISLSKRKLEFVEKDSIVHRAVPIIRIKNLIAFLGLL